MSGEIQDINSNGNEQSTTLSDPNKNKDADLSSDQNQVQSSGEFSEIIFYPYKVKGKELLLMTEGDKPIARAVRVKRVLRNIETGSIQLELVFWAYDDWVTETVPRETIKPRSMDRLAALGMDVLGEGKKAQKVIEFISIAEQSIKPTSVYGKLGWAYDVSPESPPFKHYQIIPYTGGSALSIDVNQSEYDGRFDVAPKGSLKEYLDMIKAEVTGHPPLELMLCSGLAAPIVSLIGGNDRINVDSLLIHLVGNSTTGKTTAAMLAVSGFGNPKVAAENSLVHSFNATPNSMLKLLEGNNGIPMVFDETTMNNMDHNQLSTFIYAVAQGTARERLSRNNPVTNSYDIEKANSWDTVIITTGESSIIQHLNHNLGLRARVFEFANIPWTKDADNANAIQKTLLKNYGVLCQPFIEKLTEVGMDSLIQFWVQIKQQIINELPESKLRDRIATKFSFIILAAKVFSKTFDIELSCDGILKMLIQQEEESLSERDMAMNFYESLKQYIIQYQKNFKKGILPTTENNEIWGRIEIKNGKTYCYILKNQFRKIMDDFKFSDEKVLLSQLKDFGLLHHEKDKFQQRIGVFSKSEEAQREQATGKSGYNPKGDYTYCILYEGNIISDFLDEEEQA
ncbi:DUF927 domain-containing protein [Sporolactobacillus laevolacticus]|uniref:DUF927 domain-containing protein n=1 Tax=Sporolactobacillus laevolacticus DSM 442 TaxID=1395513 RepID=V6IYX9_9BACL|nr:DUF927 domain-containing protein [Sporolactobacillus laevolacticus]EST12001.1 hypothetical protein P343_09920 [Sporolactobacillus laevolacticus DSM 442]